MSHWFKHFGGAAALVALSACSTVGSAVAQPKAATLDPYNPQDAMQLARKMQCSTVDGEQAIFSWHGIAYARRQGEKDVHLFDVIGMNTRSCSAIKDKNGDGFALVSREILLYLDKDTGEVLDTWENPWTGETVKVQQVENDPVNFESYTVGRDGKPAIWSGEIQGDQWWYRSTFPLWYPSPLAGAYQTEVGGTYHATELFNFFGRTDDLLNPETTSAKVSVGWSRISDWLPWMKMNGREGIFYVHTAGARLESWDDLPDVMKDYINTRAPLYKTPPQTGDPRDNRTSWQGYADFRNAQEKN
ncbi:DUF1838 family protein [Hyphomonas sp.]|uniref:DUF1838 family protein n=1 Tax=Hyphomonas sp. TaxID=87 RepID=UPI001D3914ED|nr:DUF1838 domain-containing protein [Hyphomonas sp.]